MHIPLLTEGESKVYGALVTLGESSIGNVLKVSGVSHSKIYDILKRLSEKGLVSTINKRGKQYFSAADPSALQLLIDEKKETLAKDSEEIAQAIQQLRVNKNKTSPKSILTSYEGIKGVKNVLEAVLHEIESGDEILILGTPRQITEQAGGYLKDWQQRRIHTGAVCKILGDVDAPSWKDKWWMLSKQRKLTLTKRSTSVSPSYLVITKNSVTTIYFAAPILAFRVEHHEIAGRYRAFFDELWKQNK